MHLLLSYSTTELGEDNFDKITNKVFKLLESFERVNVFENTYIIKINHPSDWHELKNNLTKIAEYCGCGFKFIMSPISLGGNYNGWLPKEMWPEIQSLVNSENDE